MRGLVILLMHGLALARAASFFGGSADHRPGNDIKALCTNQLVDLTTVNELTQLAHGAGRELACSEHMKTALRELQQFIEAGSSDLCSPKSVDQLTGFYNKYLTTHERLTPFEPLPKSLRLFVLAYGMQMSNLCKRNMILVLARMSESDLLNEDDLDMLKTLASDDGPIAYMLGDLAGPDQVFLPSDLAPFLRSSGLRTKKLGADKIYLQTSSTGSSIRQLQVLCERRFQPIYEPLMLPLVRLSNMGFNFRDSTLEDDLKSEKCTREVAPWSRIVFLCEALKGIHLVEDPADNGAQGNSAEEPKRLVRIITEEEARNIEAKTGKKPERLGAHDEENTEDEELVSEIAKLVYEPRTRIKLGNLIYDKLDGRFDNAVRLFKIGKSEKSIIKKRLFKKGFSMIKREIKRGHVGLLISAGFKGIAQRVKGDRVPETREELITTLDDLIKREGDDNQREVTYKLGNTQTLVISADLVALLVGLAAAIFVGHFAWLG